MRYFLTGVDHVSRPTCLGQERDFGGYELCGTRALVGRLSLSYVEGLMLDPMCDTPHVQVTPNALQLSSEVAESVNSIPMRSARSSAVLNTQQAFVSQLLDTVQPTVWRLSCMNGCKKKTSAIRLRVVYSV